jgi:hypothetical protein
MKKWLGLVALLACSDASSEDGAGTVAFTTYGEDYIEKEIPAADVEDGWSIRYDKFLVALGEVTVDGAAKMPGYKLFSMKQPGDKPVVTFAGVGAKAYPHVSYSIAPATGAIESTDGVTEADKTMMVTSGYSVYVEATATKEAVTKKYAWGFTARTLYDHCKGELSGKETDGVVVTNGGTDLVQLTIHGDHLYYDDLQSKEAKVRFGNIAAADANGDGTITLEELAAVQLAAIPAEQGAYGTGSAAGINDLRAFVEALSRTIGHFRGEGECVASLR